MTVSLKVKVVRRPTLKVKVLPHIPSALVGGTAIGIVKDGTVYTISPDYTSVGELQFFDPTREQVLVYNPIAGSFNVISLATLTNNATTTVKVITSGATYAADPNDRLIAVNKTVGGAITITLPLALAKVGPVRVSDFKGDANTNNITVNLSGSDTFPGGLTSWKITGRGASVLFTPIPGIGYAT
jgi:hypothetical protein